MNNKTMLKEQISLFLCFLCLFFPIHSKSQNPPPPSKKAPANAAEVFKKKKQDSPKQNFKKNLKTPPEPPPRENSRKLAQEIQKIIKQYSIRQKQLGLAVSQVQPASLEFAVNADRLFTPASLSKIAASGAFLNYFHPFHQFQTSFLSDHSISPEGRLKGNLYLKGGGDPSFVSESMWNLVNRLVRTGVKQVEGFLVLDDSLFEKNTKPGRRWGALDRSYNAPISALSFNWNSMNIYVRPGLKQNQQAAVWLDPRNTYLQLKNKVQTKGLKTRIKIRKKQTSQGKELVKVQGQIPLYGKEFSAYRSISDPLLYTGYNAVEFLRQRNIFILKGLKKGKTPDSSQILALEKGRTVSQLLKDMMKFSSNFIADMLTMQLSIHQEGGRGNFRKGLKWIYQYLEEKGIKKYSFDQPSGLSKKNKLKPNHLLKLLINDFHSPYSHEKLSAYPLAGGDGTLKKRLSQLKHPFLIRAKTGRLSGVEGLAGYAEGKQGRTRAFVFIYNGSARKQDQARKLFDDLAAVLTRH